MDEEAMIGITDVNSKLYGLLEMYADDDKEHI